jgi:hypothetical protein
LEHPVPYGNTLSEYGGLQNKTINVKMTVWEPTYLECKIKVQEAATILRSTRRKYGRLYIQNYDKYYQAMPKSLTSSKDAGTSVQLLEYDLVFDAKPWLISNDVYSVTGTGTIDTGSRTIMDGGWTPTTIIVSGTNVQISGVTEGGQNTGLITVSGTVSNFVIDSDNFTSSDNSLVTPKDYGLHVGPGKTIFTTTGATSCRIEWHNRWYL